MSGEHEDHDNENNEREPRIAAAERAGLPADESGPRASAQPVVDHSSIDPFSDGTGREHSPQHRSAPPPRPRLKDSKYPPPTTGTTTTAATTVAEGAPPPRKKVISSPDLPRPRTTPPPEAGSDPELGSALVVPRAPGRPHDMLGDAAARPPLVPPARQRMATLREGSDDDIVTPPRLANEERVILPPSAKGIEPSVRVTEPGLARTSEPGSARVSEPSSVRVSEPGLARTIEPSSPPAPRVMAPPAGPAPTSSPPSKVLVPPPKPERRDEYVATYSRTPSLKPPPLPPSPERVAPPSAERVAPPSAEKPRPPPPTERAGVSPAAASAPASPGSAPAVAPAPPAAAAPAAPPAAAAPAAAAPGAAPPAAAPPAAPVATAPAVLTPPPPAVRPASTGAATSYPPPSNPPPPVKTDSIAVHAIRVINIGVDDTALPPPPAPAARSDGDDFENIEEYTEEEFEPPPDSLDEADVQALTEDEPNVPKPPALPTEGAPPPSAPASDVKLPPPPKRQAPSPPKKKGPRAPARKRRPWWEEVFSEDFARATHHLSPRHIKREVDFIDQSLGVAQGAVVLDLACGTGEHSIELASRGYSVVGFDLSVYQLAIAGETAQERELKINFLQGDMREMAFQEMFDGVFCWNTSFGYFEEEKNVAVAERIFQALRPGGMLLLDVVNRDHVMQHQPSQVWFQGDACVCMDDMSVDYITSRLRVKRSIIMDDGRTRECSYSIRLYTLHELGKLLHQVGFRVVEASGHPTTPGVYLGPNSPRVIILAQRP